VKHSVSNGKRHVSNVNKRAKMFAVCAWTQIAVSGCISKRMIESSVQYYHYAIIRDMKDFFEVDEKTGGALDCLSIFGP
jgi:hypothetical protein